jgi:very-short-patch-repair endonuclease
LRNIEKVIHPLKTKGGDQKMAFIKHDDVIKFLVASRKPTATDLAKEFGVNVLNHKYECKESETLGAIMKAFKGEKMRLQHPVFEYQVDLYFPDYNLCIECDENGHADREDKDEKKRQRRITKKLKCQWLRFDPDDPDFNIFETINQIFTIIKAKVTNYI